MNIFVAKLSPQTKSEDLQDLFGAHGEVTSAKVIMDRETGRSKLFGFVEMANDDEASQAIESLDNTEVSGARIVVKKARPREEGGSGDSRGGYQQRSNQRRY
jgi:RNA recognition motif-containing protein